VVRACTHGHAHAHVHETDVQKRKVTFLAGHVSSRADNSNEYYVTKRLALY